MAQAHFVKKAQKDNPAVKKGESYWWWAFRISAGKSFISRKCYSATRPKPSQLIQSEYLSSVLAVQETIWDSGPGLESQVEDCISNLESIRDETQGKFDNMPEGLQQGETGQLLEARVAELDEALEQLQAIDFDVKDLSDRMEEEEKQVEIPSQDATDDHEAADEVLESDEEYESRIQELVDEEWDEKVSEVEEAISNLGSAS